MAKIPTFKPLTAQELTELKRDASDEEEEKELLLGAKPGTRTNPFRRELRRKIADMGFDDALLKQVSPKVRELTIQDLEDFARKIAGVEVANPRVNDLTIEDMQGVEALFRDQREQALATAAARLGDSSTLGRAADVDVSCCCCTPCCCCAATEVSPFAGAEAAPFA